MDKSLLLNKQNWLFDLDNTIYPAENNLFVEMNVKMRSYVMKLLDLDSDNAHSVQKQYLHEYGTTLAGLIAKHDVDAMDFLDYVHDLDYSVVEYDDDLKNVLTNIPNKKYIHTNGTKSHSQNVLDKMEISDLFVGCFDIVGANFIPKPQQSNYDIMINEFNINPSDSVFFEDMAVNLVVPKQMGMTTVWLENELNSHQYEQYKDYIDYKTNDLVKFLSFE
ncbi:MAG: pyrimidine 5'-nucleotidase [Alphaproteobacteria bacterium]